MSRYRNKDPVFKCVGGNAAIYYQLLLPWWQQQAHREHIAMHGGRYGGEIGGG